MDRRRCPRNQIYLKTNGETRCNNILGTASRQNPEEVNGTWKIVQEMTRNGTYTEQLSPIVNEKYKRQTIAMKD